MNLLVDHGAYLNLGDIAMLESAVTRLHHVVPDARLHVVYRDVPTNLFKLPFVTRAPNYEIDLPGGKASPVARRVTLVQLAAGKRADTLPVSHDGATMSMGEFCRPYDALHLAGSGTLNDVFPGELLKKCALLLTFAAQNKPTLLSGQQLGPFRNPLFKRVLRRALRGADFVGLREPTESAALCREFGLERGRFAVMGDDALGVACANAVKTFDVLSACGVESKKFIALNLRIHQAYAPEFARYARFLAALAETLAERLGMMLLFVPIATDREQGDSSAAQRVVAEMPHAGARILDRPDLNPGMLKAVLAHARGAVGASYHFCAFALGAGTPTVNLYNGRYYTQKAAGLTAFWGDARLAYHLQNGNVQSAAQHILAVFNDDTLSEKLHARARDAVTNWETIFDAQARRYFGSTA